MSTPQNEDRRTSDKQDLEFSEKGLDLIGGNQTGKGTEMSADEFVDDDD